MKLGVLRLLSTLAILSCPAVTMAASHALLIAVSDYSSSGIDSLDGPRKDVELMRDVLMRRFSVPRDNIREVYDRQATHSGLEREFSELAARVSRGDMVYIQYSGHGSYVADENGDEPSGQDQTWVSYGSRSPAANGIDAYDVLDDEIDGWLAGIFAKTDHVIFVSDSCHSATVTRGRGPKVRAAPPAKKGAHPRARAERFKPATAARAVRIGAAGDTQLAAEFRHEDGTYYGMFTWHWAQALDAASPGATWADVFQRTATLVQQTPRVSQRPQMEGDPNLLVFGGEFTSRPPTLAVTEIRRRRDIVQVSLDAGELAGVTVGSIYQSHESSDDTAPDARLEILSISPWDSTGRLLAGVFERGQLVAEVNHAYRFVPSAVFVTADLPDGPDQETVSALRRLVANELPAYRLVNSQATSDVVLRVMRPTRDADGRDVKAHRNDALPAVNPTADPEVWILTPLEAPIAQGARISMLDRKKGVRRVHENLEKLARVREFRNLVNAGGDALISVEIILLIPVPDCAGLPDCGDLWNLGPHHKKVYSLADMPAQIAVDSLVSFRITNEGELPYHVYILSSGPTGEIQPNFPDPDPRTRHSPDMAFLESGDSLDLIEGDRTRAAIGFDSPGEELIRIIASTQPIRMELLKQEGLRARSGPSNPLERLLVSAQAQARGDDGTFRMKNYNYAVKGLDLKVVADAGDEAIE